MSYILLVVGLVLLVIGAEALVRGASRLALIAGVTPLIIGLTVVAFGTSAPELVLSTVASAQGDSELALGNVVGSNIFNILFILGVSAIIIPLVVASKLLRFEVPLLIGVSAATWIMALNGVIGRAEGALLFVGILIYVWYSVRQSRKESKAIQQEYTDEFGNGRTRGGRVWAINGLLVIVGLGLLIAGSRLLVMGATDIARSLGVSELIIGLTIVAAGTSMPEVATSITAAIRGERDIAVGNVIGSNIFNLLAVLGASALVARDGLLVPPQALRFDFPVMLAATLATLPIFFTGHLIARWEGWLFLAAYVAYTGFLILDAIEHYSLATLNDLMLFVVLPLVLVTIAVSVVRELRSRRRAIVNG